MLLALVLIALLARTWRFRFDAGALRRRPAAAAKQGRGRRFRPKPAWVRAELLRLKALLPDAGCRTIAMTFNRKFRHSRGQSVGKSHVADVLRRHAYEAQVLRRRMKNRRPRRIPRNLLWGLDLTERRDAAGVQHFILAIVEHASRACLRLDSLTDKRRATILPRLIDAMRRYGRPRILITDNERIFSGLGFRLALWLLGVRHRLITPGCPWENGRVERLFGTLKERLNRLEIASRAQLARALAEFRFWYNHVRPHQNLDGATPAERWAGVDVNRAFRRAYWFDAWDGLLRGYYLRR